MCTTSPQVDARGSAVHLTGQYFLTANHVATTNRQVTFDGDTFYAIDTDFTPITIGTADLKLCKLLNDPDLPDTVLNTSSSEFSPSQETVMIGYGRGRSTSQEDPSEADGDPVTWTWGNASTTAKRWGTNTVERLYSITADDDYDYTYAALGTISNSDAGDVEAALAVMDSGSGLFQKINDQWVLAGIATVVTTNGSSTFAIEPTEETDPTPDQSLYVRVSELANAIEAALIYAGWAHDYALSGTDATYDADPDNDGSNNLTEYAMGTDPRIAEPTLAPQLSLTDTTASLTWQQISLPAGMSISVQMTDNLLTTPFSDSGLTPEQTGTDGTLTTWAVSLEVPAGEQRFLRLAITTSD